MRIVRLWYTQDGNVLIPHDVQQTVFDPTSHPLAQSAIGAARVVRPSASEIVVELVVADFPYGDFKQARVQHEVRWFQDGFQILQAVHPDFELQWSH